MDAVYRCLAVFMGVANTSKELEPILFMQKRRIERRGVNVFADFMGEDNFLALDKNKRLRHICLDVPPELAGPV